MSTSAKRYRFFRSQRAQVTAALLTVAIIPLLVIFGYQAFLLDRAKAESIEAQQAQTQQIVTGIRSFVEMHRRGIEAAAFQAGATGDRSPAFFNAILESLHRQFPGFINLYFADARAVTLAFFPEFNAKGESMVGVDFSSRWHYAQLLRRPATYISPVMKGVGGTEKLLCTIVAPYFDRAGQFEGFVLGALNLEKIGGIVDAQLRLPHAYAVVTDSVGQGIYGPSWSADKMPENAAEEFALPDIPDTGFVSATHYSPHSAETVFTTAASVGDPEWHVYISMPESARNAALHSLLLSGFGLIFLTISAVLAASRALSVKLADAIELLSRKAARIEQGRFREADGLRLATDAPTETLQLEAGLTTMAHAIEASDKALRRANEVLEERVQERTATLSAALRSIRDAFGLIDPNGRFSVMNVPLRGLIGASDEREAVDGDRFLALMRSRGFTVSQALENALHAPSELLVSNADESRFLMVVTFAVISSDGRDCGMGLLMRDVTEEQKLDRMKDALIAVAAHEFKTPVASLRMQAETLARKDVEWDRETIDDMIAGMLEDTERLQRLIVDWLDISRLEAGSLKLHISSVSLPALIEQSRKAVARSCDFDFIADVGPGAERLDADPGRVIQILVNLFTNACRYCDARPLIRVKAFSEGERVVIDVADNGIGIRSEDIERIFGKFHQADRSSSRRSGGTGLGLSIARGLAQAHGGGLSARSEPGRGSVFTLCLPKHSKQPMGIQG